MEVLFLKIAEQKKEILIIFWAVINFKKHHAVK